MLCVPIRMSTLNIPFSMLETKKDKKEFSLNYPKYALLDFPRDSRKSSFLLPLFQEGQLSVTGESMCTK